MNRLEAKIEGEIIAKSALQNTPIEETMLEPIEFIELIKEWLKEKRQNPTYVYNVEFIDELLEELGDKSA